MNREEKITLAELQAFIRDKIYESLPGSFWVIAEIAEIKVQGAGHCYLELTSSDTPGGMVTARARGIIWASKYRSLNTFFTASTGIPLRQGITILFKATVEYHELYGLSLNITDIDPAYTSGDMALRREAIIRKLTTEGVISMNKELPLPDYPRHIAVVSSAEAAGYRDFIRHLLNNAYGYVFEPQLFEATMQGKLTDSSVTEALDQIAEEIERFDVVVIIRGGGSTTDLSWFDSYDIAFHVTQFPLPVLTGIGHEKDLSVTDMVAWKSLKTPTAVADFLVEQTIDCENRIIEMANSIASAVRETLSSTAEHLAILRNRAVTSSRLIVKNKREQMVYFSDRLGRTAANAVRTAAGNTEKLEDALHHLDPARVLRRGFTLTAKEGKIITSPAELSPGDNITTHFEKGYATSIVEKTTKK